MFKNLFSAKKKPQPAAPTVDIKTAVVKKVKDHYRKTGVKPTTLHLSLAEEIQFKQLPVSVLGEELSRQIAANGVRQALKDGLFGLKIVWDADFFRVE